jgi:hypothetical protein
MTRSQSSMIVLLTIVAHFFFAGELLAQTVIYVDDDAAGANNGSSWCDAFIYLQDALAAAADSSGTVNEIRVAQGAYQPDQGEGLTLGDRDASFNLQNGVAIRGGYAGCGVYDPNARDVEAYVSVLYGDITGDDETTGGRDCCTPHEGASCENEACATTVCEQAPQCCEFDWSHWCAMVAIESCSDMSGVCSNSRHIVSSVDTDASASLDGFTVTRGFSDLPTGSDEGGSGLSNVGDPMISHCTFTKNAAGGYFAFGGAVHSSGSPTF